MSALRTGSSCLGQNSGTTREVCRFCTWSGTVAANLALAGRYLGDESDGSPQTGSMQAHHTVDAAEAWSATRTFLEADPVLANVPITVLGERIGHDEPGDYWWVTDRDVVVAFASLSPPARGAYVVGARRAALEALAVAVAQAGAQPPMVTGEAAAASAFASTWAERRRTPVHPTEAQGIYTLDRLVPPARTPTGFCRPATAEDVPTLSRWFDDMATEVGTPVNPRRSSAVARSVEAGGWHIWDDDGPVSVAHQHPATSGFARIGPVYTPPDERGHGYGTAVTASASAGIEATGAQAMLFTQLTNPTSNAIYRALGYRQVADVLIYELDA